VARKRIEPKPQPPSLDPWELGLFLLVVATVTAVAVLYRFDVNRIFDVPKAVALKLGGSVALAGWLVLASVRGVRWDPARKFAGPVVALLLAVGLSTLFSIDPWTSFNGVYERQFGFQGYLACAGLFFVAATCVRGLRGAVFGVGVLAFLGGLIGHYARVQGRGQDPFGFFTAPKNKVYTLLGNATFAGNALALIFPVCTLLTIVAVVRHVSGDEADKRPWTGAVTQMAVGAGAMFLLQLAPLLVEAPPRWGLYVAMLVASGAFMVACLALGSWGPEGLRLAGADERRWMDGLLTGALVACTVGIVLGLYHTRTRGAWVGSLMAIAAGAALLPELFRERRALIRSICWSGLLVLGASLGMYVWAADGVAARTFRSIPQAFSPEKKNLGKGQGTRPYLWGESPRVLVRHSETLARMEKDVADVQARVDPEDLEVPFVAPKDAPRPGWRNALVWPFGIGIETYRYAFMSHKSKRLEALDPMTNHDNPHNNYLYLLASLGIVGLAAYLWLLARLVRQAFAAFRDPQRGLTERMLAFGVVTSFCSYAVYSIAGFDSIACSVFLFFLLGVSSHLFQPEPGPRRRLVGSPEAILSRWPAPVGLAAAVAVILLCGVTVQRAWTVYRAEKAFSARPPDPKRSLLFKIDQAEEAIRINPGESYYRQNLGGYYARAATLYRQQAQQAKSPSERQRALRASERAFERAESALYSALVHAWAPENIFITAFQLYYQLRRPKEAEWALERALEHSPHLGAVRANLAQLKLERNAPKEAIRDCKWVLEVSPRNTQALQACGQAKMMLGQLEVARGYLERARRLAPQDARVTAALNQLRALEQAATTTTAALTPATTPSGP
jgi:Flp pilus assembly protein TadD